MTSDHDKLLAEGPRTAPEPLTAPDLDGSATAAAPPFFEDVPPEVPPSSASPVPTFSPPTGPVPTGTRPVGARPRRRPTYVRLLIPAVAIMLAVARSAFNGHSGGAVVGVISVVLLIAFIGLRRWRF